ncbi:MAG: hypothetical protein JRC56_01965 [Deltaproteobacteria bacterium]|nr:hypothetical protein [Deltaproteobacteria bacterium]
MSKIQPKKSQPDPKASDLSVGDRVPAVEKRKEARVAANVPVTVVFYDPPDDDFYNQPGTAVNTSCNGICIEMPMHLGRGHPVLIRTNRMVNRHATGSAAGRAYHGEVQWCRRYRTVFEDMAYRTGICFYEPTKRTFKMNDFDCKS